MLILGINRTSKTSLNLRYFRRTKINKTLALKSNKERMKEFIQSKYI